MTKEEVSILIEDKQYVQYERKDENFEFISVKNKRTNFVKCVNCNKIFGAEGGHLRLLNWHYFII